MAFSRSDGWGRWLCALLRHNASVVIAWDQVRGLQYERDCHTFMGLDLAHCLALKPAERFIVPLAAGIPTIGYSGYPSFREAAHAATPRPVAAKAADLLLTKSVEGVRTRLSFLLSNQSQYERARSYGRAIGEAHSMDTIVAAYEHMRSSALRVKASGARCSSGRPAPLPATSMPRENSLPTRIAG